METRSFALPFGLSLVARRHIFSTHYIPTEVLETSVFSSMLGCLLIPTGYTFRRDGRYFVLAERHKSKDTIGVYDAAEEYKLARVRFSRPDPSQCYLKHSFN